MALTTPTKPHFPRFEHPLDSRSPSRSPRRKAQFAIKELDPLLGNLSPDSTLRALQATDTIPGSAAHDALTSSIGDATPAERERGIRAAFAAQKLREWTTEISGWSWPGKRERASGLGFITPFGAKGAGMDYRGFLTVTLADEYESRLDDIRDDLESLGMEEIKDHVLESHTPAKADPQRPQMMGNRRSYGRMRDFTALITATVIQALPDLAKLNTLLDIWDIRLRVLKELPRFLEVLESTQHDIQAAFNEVRNSDLAQNVTGDRFESRKAVLGSQVSDVGRRIDRLLDMLEGQEDSLPQTWIDRLEKIELDYATWVVEAEHVVLRNRLATRASRSSEPENLVRNTVSPVPEEVPAPKLETPNYDFLQSPFVPDAGSSKEDGESTSPSRHGTPPRRKPSLKLNISEQKGHRREISKVSVADSTYSAFSDISNAEIMDAKTTSVLPSPKVNLIDNPFRASRDELTWFGNPSIAQEQMATKPPLLQRASTASYEVVSKDHLKRVMLTRSASWDMLSQIPQSPERTSPESTPSKALRQLTGSDSPVRTPLAELEGSEIVLPPPSEESTGWTPLATPSLEVQPLRVKTRDEDLYGPSMPAIPRKSSKRGTLNGTSTFSPLTPISSASPVGQSASFENWLQGPSSTDIVTPLSKSPRTGGTLDDRIQDLLTTLPTKIRLSKDTNAATSAPSSSTASTRSPTPTPALTLAPAKAETSSRKGGGDDSEIRVYHLTRTGQARDVPPVKLFVRTVGDGRVMVRVGGGWADLGEYLKEYSLHHGSRATADGNLEVASLDSTGATGGAGVTPGQGRKMKSPSATKTAFDIGSASDTTDSTGRTTLTRVRSPEPGRRSSKDGGVWTPPPVPPIPSSLKAKSPTLARSGDGTSTDRDVVSPGPTSPSHTPGDRSSMTSTTTLAPGVTTTTIVTPPTTTTTKYTPLGGAGPKTNPRRAATHGALSSSNNDAWVENMVGKARAVSGGTNTTSIVHGPTTTTTTTVTSSTPTSNRRASSFMNLSPNSNSTSSPVTISPASSTASNNARDRRSSLSMSGRSKSRISLSDMSGIKRVFLRRKTENVK
ncbi:hypothetical protein LTR10_021659 [Elasticomyces elasticus]|uniref:GAR domain-containing protein n=1 Tax=Exophiala sideris TaxID=1016849 RepID=A0ABR0JA54_9EURO|nr:hypothetical protein LTR10_021659 [Elasticomyces elasticus]KAK5022195.1 hypothetical protein LTS07_010274 [Exophiala sideris]KAK5037363.1 hypothetical protein LTR13_004520 [Exophiala sideris]KAK5059027.1 hypothetical protein LTR69_006315 [Exophiala sideris]KAK5182859.1 hypothetical protein LTR44_004568 [Eurotiomycetes sp. CCFEE 6388]